jgi:CO/xanthine dehydrogenase Mo-binding subunit
VTIWSPTQHPFVLQRVVAACLGLPLARVRIVAPDPGGGFGGKGWPKFEPLLAYMALRLGRAVRLVLTLEESFQAARRTSARIQARSAFDRDGRILSQDLRTDFLVGAYADIGIRVVSKASYAACGPYLTPHASVHARALLSHTTPSTAFRGFGNAPGVVGRRVAVERGRAHAWHRRRRDPPAQPAAQGRGVHPGRHAG